MAKIFISYRRNDASSTAALLADRIRQRLAADAVFFDQECLRGGDEWRTELEEQIDDCQIFLVMIGPRWQAELGKRSRAGQKDVVHEEISRARERAKTIWAVLLDGAELSASELPDDLSFLGGELQYSTIQGDTSAADIKKLLDDLIEQVFDRTGPGHFGHDEWKSLLESLADKKCVPIIGPALGDAGLPGENPTWVNLTSSSRPLKGFNLFGEDLPRVAEIANVNRQWSPHDALGSWAGGSSDVQIPEDHPYAVLSKFSLPLYITTNYDRHLDRSLGDNAVTVAVPPLDNMFGNADMDPDGQTVVHFLGVYDNPRSMIVTEDEFFELLIRMISSSGNREGTFFPTKISEELLRAKSYLLIGFDLSDWRFRLLMRGLSELLSVNPNKVFAVVDSRVNFKNETILSEEDAAAIADSYLNRALPGGQGYVGCSHIHISDTGSFISELRMRVGDDSGQSDTPDLAEADAGAAVSAEDSDERLAGPLTRHTRPELDQEARRLGIAVRSGWKKGDVVEAVQDYYDKHPLQHSNNA